MSAKSWNRIVQQRRKAASVHGPDDVDREARKGTPERVVEYGPGFYRMQERLGPETMEAMRLDVIDRQYAAREAVSGERVQERDRTSYKTYPKPSFSKDFKKKLKQGAEARAKRKSKRRKK